MKGGSAWLSCVALRRVSNNKAAQTTFRRQNNKQINHDRVSIRLDLPKQRKHSAPTLSFNVLAATAAIGEQEHRQHLNQVDARANLAELAAQECFCTASALGLQCEHQRYETAERPPTLASRLSPRWMSLEIADRMTANDYGAVCGPPGE